MGKRFWEVGMTEFKRGASISSHIIIMIVFIFILSSRAMGEEKEEKKDKKEETQTIQTKKIGKKRVLKREVFEKLPKGRDFISILPLLPGINHETLLDGISIDGASSAENKYYIDGVDTTTLFTGESGVRVNFDFIEEVRVRTAGISAQYAGSTGGAVHIKTRSGGNEFHGRLSVYFDGSALGYNPRPTLRVNPLNEDAAEYVTYPEDNWTRWEPGFSLGGPIVKDKLWFFAGFMPKFITTTRNGDNWPLPGGTIFGGEPHMSGSNTFTRKDTGFAGSLKLTGQVTDNLRLSISGTMDYNKWKGELPDESFSNPYEKRDYGRYVYEDPKFTIGGSVDYTPFNNLVLSAAFGYYRADHKQVSGPPDGPRYYFPVSNAEVPGAVTVKPGGWSNYGYYDGYRTTKQVEDRLTGAFDITCHVNVLGEHVFKAGARMERIGVDKDEAYAYDYNRFYWGRNYEHSNGTTQNTTLGYIEVREPIGVVAEFHSPRWAIYAQDSWTIAGKLTLTLGARWENEDYPAFVDGEEPPIQFNFSDKFAPRVGFVYNVLENSSLTIFGGFGIYYDVMKLALAERFYGGFKWLSHYYDIVNPDWENAYPETDHPQEGGLAGGRYFQTRNWREYRAPPTQPDIKPFQKNEFTLGIRKTFKETWTLGVRFLHNYIKNAVEDLLHNSFEPIYLIGNPGSDWYQGWIDELITYGYLPRGIKASRAVREYTSVTLSLDRKFKDNWLGGISYTWSRLYGNYAGLASSDEEGRNSPNTLTYFDWWFQTYNQFGREAPGLLRTDRTHQLKLYGAYVFDFGLTLGFNAYAMSGIPVQTELYLFGSPRFYPLGRGSEGRTPWLWQIDLYAEYNLKLNDALTLQFNVNITNLTDNDTARSRNMVYNSWAYLTSEQVIDGFDYLQLMADKGYRLDPRYNMEYDYLDAVAARLGVKLIF